MLNNPMLSNTTEFTSFVILPLPYRTIVSRLNDLFKGKKQQISWTLETEESFREIKEAPVSTPILHILNFPIIFHTM